MGGTFDDPTSCSHTHYYEKITGKQKETNQSPTASMQALQGRRLLYWLMTDAGFANYPAEWWHYDWGTQMWVQNHTGKKPKTAFYGYSPPLAPDSPHSIPLQPTKTMGWNAIKQHYGIEHIVQVIGTDIHIGSVCIPDLIIIGADGTLKKRYTSHGNGDLLRYQREMDADPKTLRCLIAIPDTFKASIPIYTYEDSNIIEKQCETPHWPNCTHDGTPMYANKYTLNKSEAIHWAKRNADRQIKELHELIAEDEKTLAHHRRQLADKQAAREKLETNHPEKK
jgi:hypothetical protein